MIVLFISFLLRSQFFSFNVILIGMLKKEFVEVTIVVVDVRSFVLSSLFLCVCRIWFGVLLINAEMIWWLPCQFSKKSTVVESDKSFVFVVHRTEQNRTEQELLEGSLWLDEFNDFGDFQFKQSIFFQLNGIFILKNTHCSKCAEISRSKSIQNRICWQEKHTGIKLNERYWRGEDSSKMHPLMLNR